MAARRLLLDVNVWLAYLDARHMHHPSALQLMKRPGLRVATCPLTENAVFRILGMPRYFLGQLSFVQIQTALAGACASLDHEFWPADISLRKDSSVNWTRIAGHNQITDAYLLALAVKHDATLATLDHRIALSSVHGANADHLLLL